MKDFYAILGVSASDTSETIKKAYRKLAQKYHPDRNPDDIVAEEKFKIVNEAYSVLSDSAKRKEYDILSGRSFRDPFSSAGFGNHSHFSSIFNDIFTDTMFHKNKTKSKVKEDISKTLNLDIPIDSIKDQSVITKKIRLRKKVKCTACDGKGGEESVRCSNCNGLGRIHQTVSQGNIYFQNVRKCGVCFGQGKVLKNICKTCAGKCKIEVVENYSISIQCNLECES